MNVLFIAYYFPPNASSGSFRPMFFANYLAQHGIGVTVLTARVEDFLLDQPNDHELIAKLHPSIRIIRCKTRRPREALLKFRTRINNTLNIEKGNATANSQNQSASHWQGIKNLVTDILTTPDPHVGWIFDCVRQGKAIVANTRQTLIYATGSPWSGLLAGVSLKKATALPLIVDFRDPWTSNPSFGSQVFLTQAIARRLERRVLKNADKIIANTPNLRDDFLAKNPFLSEDKVTVISNGFQNYLDYQVPPAGRSLTISHIGSLYASRYPGPLLEATKYLIEKNFITQNEIKLKFIGEIQNSNHDISRLLAHPSLRNSIEFIPHTSYDKAQYFIQNADVLLIIQPGFPLQIPRKLYEYMAARKPILCIAEEESATARIVKDHHLGLVASNQVSEIMPCLQRLIEDWRAGKLLSYHDRSCDQFSNSALNSLFFDLIATLAQKSSKVL